jgi:hypothetical protein
MKTTHKLLLVACLLTASLATYVSISGNNAPSQKPAVVEPSFIPSQAGLPPLGDLLLLGRAEHKDAIAGMQQCDEATLGLLHAVLTGDQKQLLHFRQLLLSSDQDISGQLARLLTCGITEVEIETMRLLIQTGRSKGLAMVLGRMLNIDLSAENAYLYTAVFSQCRHLAVTDWLVSCLDGATNEALRHRAATLLSLLQGPETVISISLQLETANRSTELLRDGLEMMASRKDPSEVDALIEVFSSTEVLELRESIAFSLAGIGSANAARFLVETALRDDDDALIARAALTTISSAQAQQVLLGAALDKDIQEDTRVAAVSALHLHSGAHVAVALANIDIAPGHDDLNKAIETALHKYDSESNPPSDAGVILGENHEIWF